MEPRKPVKSLFAICLESLIKHLTKYIDQKSFKLNFFNDFDEASKSFLSRCEAGIELTDKMFFKYTYYVGGRFLTGSFMRAVFHMSQELGHLLYSLILCRQTYLSVTFHQ